MLGFGLAAPQAVLSGYHWCFLYAQKWHLLARAFVAGIALQTFYRHFRRRD
jgi:hypothetical protein